MNRAVAVALVASLLVAGSAWSQAQTERRVPRRGTQVKELVRPGESVIELVDTTGPPLLVEAPESVSKLKWLFDLADAFVLVRIDRRDGRLTAKEDWVRSGVTARVLEVFKAPARSGIVTGTSISFEEEGGEITVTGTRVNATVPSVRPLKVGATYLIAVAIDIDNGRIVFGPDTAYQLVNGRFEKLSQRGQPREVDQIEADLSDHVLVELRDFAAAARR